MNVEQRRDGTDVLVYSSQCIISPLILSPQQCSVDSRTRAVAVRVLASGGAQSTSRGGPGSCQIAGQDAGCRDPPAAAMHSGTWTCSGRFRALLVYVQTRSQHHCYAPSSAADRAPRVFCLHYSPRHPPSPARTSTSAHIDKLAPRYQAHSGSPYRLPLDLAPPCRSAPLTRRSWRTPRPARSPKTRRCITSPPLPP